VSKKNKKGLSDNEILSKHSKFKILLSVLNNKPLTTYEALILHLNEISSFNYHNIGVLLGRNERDVRKVYFRARAKLKNINKDNVRIIKGKKSKKNKKGLSDEEILSKHSNVKVAVSALRHKLLTTYEALIVHLKDDSLFNYHSIGVLLGRDERDVRKVYFRARAKLKNGT
jgi:DNA-directed RNA polymerase specialized sigma24 family protein